MMYKIMLISEHAVSDSKKSRFITEKEGLLNMTGKASILVKLLIWCVKIVVMIMYFLEY